MENFLTKSMYKFLGENHKVVHDLEDPANPYFKELEIDPCRKDVWPRHFNKATILDIAFNCKDYFKYGGWNYNWQFRFMVFWRTLTHD